MNYNKTLSKLINYYLTDSVFRNECCKLTNSDILDSLSSIIQLYEEVISVRYIDLNISSAEFICFMIGLQSTEISDKSVFANAGIQAKALYNKKIKMIFLLTI